MTEPKRPWWMLHWPSWLALVLFGAALVVLNVVLHAEFRIETQWSVFIGRATGWPFEFRDWRTVWTAGTEVGRPIGIENTHVSFATWGWDALAPGSRSKFWRTVGANFAIGLFVILASVSTIERWSRKRSTTFSLRQLFFGGSLVAALTLVIAKPSSTWLLPGMSLSIMCIAIGLASLAVLDFIGWLFGRLAKREA